MNSYKKYLKYLFALIIVISLSGNLYLTFQLRSLKRTVSTSNSAISTRVESSIRATMLSIREVKELGTKEEVADLQRSVQQLVSNFSSWIDINQTEENPNEPLQNALSGLEALRNTVVHHLNNQYSSRNEELTDFDIDLLDKIYDQLDRFLVVYSNIQDRVSEIRNPDNGDGGLSQWANNMKEISRLYRHSRIPNEHPRYIGLGSVLKSIHIMFPEINSLVESKKISEEIKENVEIQDGVHYYEISYYNEDELMYSICIDAIDGTIRKFDDYSVDTKNISISEDKALNIAKKFINRFVSYDEVIDGVSLITDENTKNITYAFQFTPVVEDICLISDIIKVNVSANSGRVIRYSSNFSGTSLPIYESIVSIEEIEDKYNDQLLDMKYTGISIVRSFYTHYRPVAAYSYGSTKKEETKKLYFDVSTGNQVYESYSVYEPVSYIATGENHK